MPLVYRERSKIMEDERSKIQGFFDRFGLQTETFHLARGPTVSTFGIVPHGTTKIAQIDRLKDDLSIYLAKRVRISVLPERGVLSLEVPNDEREMVQFCDMVEHAQAPLGVVLGADTLGRAYVADICKMPHLLIAGTTGSGKSILVHTMLCNILMCCMPDQVKFILIDPKRVEMPAYAGVPHLHWPVITEPAIAGSALMFAVRTMEMRYDRLEQADVRDIGEYNKKADKQMDYRVIVIDELADLMMTSPTTTEHHLVRLAQMARAVGMHLILATQRPSSEVITGLIKANFPARIGLSVASSVDSRVILDQTGAERLIGRGDMLYTSPETREPVRVQGAYISPDEIRKIVEYWARVRNKAPIESKWRP